MLTNFGERKLECLTERNLKIIVIVILKMKLNIIFVKQNYIFK